MVKVFPFNVQESLDGGEKIQKGKGIRSNVPPSQILRKDLYSRDSYKVGKANSP